MSNFTVEICHPTDNDVTWVTQNIEDHLVDAFEAPNVKVLFEMTPWALVAKQEGSIAAYAAFVDYPYQDHWSNEWYSSVKEAWENSQYCGLKSVFLHVVICKVDLKQTLSEMLKTTFLSIPSLDFCCVLVRKPKNLNPDLQSLFRRDETMETGEFEFWTTHRDKYIPKIGVRNKRSEDYLELKALFSRMYGPFQNGELTKLTLDFLDYGDDRMATYKYFTFDDDNTFVGLADNDKQKAVGLIYATIQRVDLDALNRLFQLESVYGLRKRHSDDDPGVDFGRGSPSVSEESCDEEDDVREALAHLVDGIVSDLEVKACLEDLVDDVSDAPKRHRRRTESDRNVDALHCPTFLNSREFDLSNPAHLRLVTRQNVRHFTKSTLMRLLSSAEFDPRCEIHMRLLPRLGVAIKELEEERIKEILSSDLFDPGVDEHALLCVHVISLLPESKLNRFQKSTVGYQIYEKLMYRLALEKKAAISKAKPNRPAPKLSFKDAQIILQHTKSLKQKESAKNDSMDTIHVTREDTWRRVSYRNMGFISGVTARNQYRVQESCVSAETCSSSEDESFKYFGSKMHQEENISEKYPVSRYVGSLRVFQEIPEYNGGTNCFHIEQFAIENRYESQSLQLIAAAFSYFPRVDYCMVLLPYGTRQVPYLRRYFCNIPARPFVPCEKELFVLHKATLCASYEVRPYDNDFKGVLKLLSGSCLKDHLLKDLESRADKTKSIVLVSEGRVFGVAVIQDIDEVETIRRNFLISDRVNMKYHKYTNQGLLLHCVVHPIFKSIAKAFLGKAMKLADKSILYYKIFPTHLVPFDPSAWQSLCNVLELLQPLKPSQRPSKLFIALKESNISKAVSDEGKNEDKNEDKNEGKRVDKYYCVAYTCTKIVLRDTKINSARIVVVGDSDVALGVLESLIFSDQVKFTNLTVVTKYGIRGEYHLDSKCYQFLPMSMNYTKVLLDKVCIPVWVTVVRGDVVSMEKNKLVLQEMSEVKPSTFVYLYDYLVICCDLEFQALSRLEGVDDSQEHLSKSPQYPLLKELYRGRATVGKSPLNVFAVNTVQEAAMVLNWLWKYFLDKVEYRMHPKKKFKSLAEKERCKREGRIVLYGDSLGAYSALSVIIDETFPLSKITFIKPSSSSSKFLTRRVEEAVDDVISKTEVDVIFDASVDYDKTAEEVVTLEVVTSYECSQLECCALLLFDEKKINYKSFTLLHKSPLSFALPVTETKEPPFLLVKQNFLTNVKNVFAVGTAVAVHTEDREIIRLSNCVYNEREMGMAIGKNLKDLMSVDLQSSNALPVLSSPKTTYVKLPLGYCYILIEPPSLIFRTESDKVTENAVKRLVLGNLDTASLKEPGLTSEIDAETEDSESYDEVSDESNSEETEKMPVDNDTDQGLKSNDAASDNVEGDVADMNVHESCSQTENINQDEVEQTEGGKLKGSLPDEPEFFSLSFDKNENVTTIECLTNKDVDAIVLKNLFEVHVSQLFRILQKASSGKGKSVIYLRLTDDWVLPLDYVMFDDDDERGRGMRYEGYWREGYPGHIEVRLNSFLDSFVDRKRK